MKKRQLVIGLLAATLAATGRAQQPNVDQRLEQLEQEIRILKRQREVEQEAAAAKPKLPALQADQKGFGFKSADGNFAIRVGGQLKADGNFYLKDDFKRFTDTFTINSARLVLSGTVYKEFDYVVSGELGGSSPALWDAYLEWKHWPELQLRIGRYKQPFGLERIQSDINNSFTTLGLPSQLVPGRDVAFQIGGEVLDGVFNYAVSIANGVADGGSVNGDTTDAKDLAGRIWVSPFKTTEIGALQGLSAGFAVTYGLQDGQTNNINLASYRTAGGNTFFTYQTGATNAAFATGERLRFGPQAMYYFGRLGLLGEYYVSSQEVKRPAPGHRDTLRNNSWQVLASLALTDDEPAFRGLTPKKPFSLKDGTWGAFEVVGRFGVFDVDNDAFVGTAATRFASPFTQASKATAWGVGLNWYLNKNVRAALDFDHTAFDGGASKTVNNVATVADRAGEHFLSSRFQVGF